MARPRPLVAAPLLIALAATGSAWAHDPDEEGKKEPSKPSKTAEEIAREERALEVSVHADKPGDEAASRVEYGRRELELRPRLRPADILEAVPGLFTVQHSGGGKANQYFLRGFDADHGTDVAFFVDGAPVNMVSHAHGQGFSDFHFLIPEVVVGLEGYKGPYYAHLGDFATAGAVNLRLAEKLDESYAQYSVGQYGVMRGLVVASPDLGDTWRLVAAAELYKEDGPFVHPEKLQRFNLYLRATHDLGARSKVQATWMSYGSSWYGSGQIPSRVVCDDQDPPRPGCLSRFDSIDPSEGGATQRHMGQLSFTTATDDADFNAMAYFVKYRFQLYSDFTFFLDPVAHPEGDEIEQDDDRVLGGFDARWRKHYHYRGAQFTTSIGAQARVDGIDNALYHDVARQQLSVTAKDHITESELALYVEEDVRVRRFLRFLLGGRVQRLDVDVDDQRVSPTTMVGKNSGAQGAMMFLPKAMAVVSPVPQLDLFASYGVGFHSNDARGVVRDARTGSASIPQSLMVKATGYEVGVRAKPVPGLELTAAGFLLDLDSEQTWNGDAGDTSPSAQTRRYGIELTSRHRFKNWLFADVAGTFTHAAYTHNSGNGDAVALAPTRTLSASIGARPTFGSWTPFAEIRLKSIGSRPATQDGSLTAQGFAVVDANAGLRWKNIEAALDVQNLFNAKWREAQFATTSRLRNEATARTDIDYTPGWPFTAMGRATVYWK
jgi:hypothetical protein